MVIFFKKRTWLPGTKFFIDKNEGKKCLVAFVGNFFLIKMLFESKSYLLPLKRYVNFKLFSIIKYAGFQ